MLRSAGSAPSQVVFGGLPDLLDLLVSEDPPAALAPPWCWLEELGFQAEQGVEAEAELPSHGPPR
jgi:hypothetical protein